ncbi:MAG: lipoprotein LpqV [Mycobacterium sp.]|nr:lipoprotein LpqV [Mycobacterium sp.]
MRPNPSTALLGIAATACFAMLVSAGCSSAEESTPDSATSTSATSTTELPPLPAGPAPSEAIGVSPGGVTTRVDAPSDATESQYGQACHAAKIWMNGQQGEPAVLVENYLKTVQAPGVVDPGNFNTPWEQLTAPQQAGVIMAVTGAANGECE